MVVRSPRFAQSPWECAKQSGERERESFASGKRDAERGRERRERREEPENGPSCVLIVVRVERERGRADCDLFSLFVMEHESWKMLAV